MSEFATLYLEEIPARDDEEDGVTEPTYTDAPEDDEDAAAAPPDAAAADENSTPGDAASASSNAASASSTSKAKAKKKKRRRGAKKKRALHWSCRVVQPKARPTGRGGASLVADGNYLYLFGGADRTATHFGDLWRYDCVQTRWARLRTKGEGPSARADHACVNLGDGRLLIQGGADLKNEVMYDDAFLLDLESLRWTQVATTGTKPFGRNGHSMVVVTPGELLVFGGASPEEGPQNDMYVLRLTGEAEGVWEQLTWEGEGPPERDLHAGCVISLGENSTSASGDIAEEAPEDVTGDAGCDEAKVPETPQTEGDAGEPAVESSAAPTESKTPARRNGMCVIGGRGVMGNVFDDAWVFDLAAGTWSRLRSLPGPRCAAAAATLEVDGQEVVVLQGGWDGATSISGDLYAFTVREGGWSSAGVSETPRFGGCGCAGASGEDLYVFGGINPGADLADVMVLRGAPAP